MVKKPRPYQADAIHNVIDDFRGGHKSTAVILPTGGGKTFIFNELISHHLETRSDALVLVLSHLSVLTHQNKASMGEMYPEIKTGILKAQTTPEHDDKVIYGTMQSVRDVNKVTKWLKSGYGVDKKVTFIVVDEAHHTQSDSYDKILEYFKNIPVFFCTATPYKESQVMLPYFGKVSYSVSTQDLIDQGYLVPPVLKQILLKGYDVNDRIAQVTDLYQREESGKQAIVFMKEINDCKLCRNAFENIGVKAEAVNSDVKDKSREVILDKFKHREIQVLVTCSVLSEGFDAPCSEVCFLPYRTGSPTLYLQRIGRFLRPYDGKQDARIYAFGDAPSIKKGLYKKVHQMAIDKGGAKEPDIFDELEYLDLINEDKKSSVYRWTQDICKVAGKLEALGMYGIFDLVRNKNFPQKFLKNLGLFASGLDAKHNVDKTGITPQQIEVLRRYHFTDNHLNNLDKGNASSMIAILNNIKNNVGHGVLAEGLHFGKHIEDLPYGYRRLAWVRGAMGYKYKGEVFEQIRKYYRDKKGTKK